MRLLQASTFTPKRIFMKAIIFIIGMISASCVHAKDYKNMTVPYVDLERFSGSWYVQGHTHLWLDKGAVNQIEHYDLVADDKIDITFSYFKDFESEQSVQNPKAKVVDLESNAHWKVQFLWPFKSDFLVVRLEENYEWTVISVPKKNLIWIMSRDKVMDDGLYQEIVADLGGESFKVEALDRVPQVWNE